MPCRLPRTLLLLLTAGLPASGAAGIPASQPASGHLSSRTLIAAIEFDRDQARLVAYTVKPRPFRSLGRTGSSTGPPVPGAVVEIALLGPSGERQMQLIDLHGLCLAHGPGEKPHVEGDVIVLHRLAFLVELPELSGWDRVEVSLVEEPPAGSARRAMGELRLDRAHFTPAGGPTAYDDLAIADAADDGTPVVTAATVVWPEDLGDPVRFHVYGDAREGDRRFNITIVPDGYVYSEKALVKTHADALVGYMRSKTPFKEHDVLVNYTLVYAYSIESGTDQCDCGIVRNTAMGTAFDPRGDPCGGGANRLLVIGSSCDPGGTNIAAAELRAPVHDSTVVMVNTTRYGGSGGFRAVYAAGNSLATDIALHELGHSLAQLADEYVSFTGCGGGAGEINTSADPVDGAWPEWVNDLGSPREGAHYYSNCIYRPLLNCEMRQLLQPFCPVCSQRWALSLFGHPRVAPTAPVVSSYPPASASACVDVPMPFVIETRLPGSGATSSILWTLEGPGLPGPVEVDADVVEHTQSFAQTGSYTLTADVVADTGFVKPQKYGVNRDTVVWNVTVAGAPGDMDGDGCGSAVDCDETRSTVRPGAAQICDGANNDCNHAGWPSTAMTNEADDDGDQLSECQGDCDDAVSAVWGTPGAPGDVVFTGAQTLGWNAPAGVGGTSLVYDVVRASSVFDFFTGAVCVESDDGSDLSASDAAVPAPGGGYSYLVRPENGCPGSLGIGSMGTRSDGMPRSARSCP